MLNSRPKGFTLVEVLIAVVLIGIIAIMGGVSYFRARKQAEFNNVFSATVSTIQKARLLGVNSQQITDAEGSWTPDYFEAKIITSAEFQITVNGYSTQLDSSNNIRKQEGIYNFQALSDFELTAVDNSATNVTNPTIKYSAPFGDITLEKPKITFTFRNTDTGQTKTFSLDKISGIINYE